MRNIHKLAAAVALALAFVARSDNLFAQSGYDLFQKALATERADGNLRQAIQIYARVVSDSAGDRPLTARALIRMAECYGKLGDAESQRIYERVTRDFADQADSFREVAATPAGDAHVNNLAVSPDGRVLAFTVVRGKVKAVLVLPTQGGEAREIFRSTGDFQIPNLAGLAWTPDGREILVVKAGAGTDDELWSLSADGGTPRPVGLRATRLMKPTLHPDGRQVAFQAGQRTWEIWALENLQRPARQDSTASR